MKKTNIFAGAAIAAICITSSSLSPIFAQERVDQTEIRNAKAEQMQNKVTEMKEKKEEVTQKRITLKKENATKEIDRRIASLQKLSDKISAMKRISATQMATLTSQIKLAIQDLTTLRAAIVLETDATALATHKKSIIDSYRVYALFMPKITIIAHGDRIIETAKLMLLKAPTAESQAKINSAISMAEEAIKTVIDLSPSEYPTNKSNLESARTLLKDAIKELNLARPMLVKTSK